MTSGGITAPVPQMQTYRAWLERERGLAFNDYADLWTWSTTHLDAFWQSIWDFHNVQSPTRWEAIIRGTMPDATWFDGAQVNYARQIFRHVDAAEQARQPAIVAENEIGQVETVSWAELRQRTASLALELRAAGVNSGDRVAAYLPNISDTVIAFLACASIGAIWSLCSPEMGTRAVLDRLRQIDPKVLIAIDGVHYAGKRIDRSSTLEEIRGGLPKLKAVFVLRSGCATAPIGGVANLREAQARRDAAVSGFEPEWLPFDHPLWILYSSGTTGLPKAIVHGHGGVILTGCVSNMHIDLGASYAAATVGERFHWYSATGWVMWNIQVGALLAGTTICLYDGAPRGQGATEAWATLWSFAARHKVTWFGAGAAFYGSCQKSDLALNGVGDLSAVRALGSTGSPLPAAVEQWGSEQFAAIGQPKVWWCNISGGTDVYAAFVSGNRELPPTPGRIQCRALGAAIESWDEAGRSLLGEVGELVCIRPFPSMPLFLWGDADGSRYRATYFDTWPGVWRHGDWLTIEEDGSCIISGRSDATINRHGLRMGTAEIYAAVEGLPEIADTLVIDVEDDDGGSKLIMFVVLNGGCSLDDRLIGKVATAIRRALSPRFVPDLLLDTPTILRTLSGKKQELPVKRLFKGWPAERVLDPDLIANPEAIPWYLEAAAAWLDGTRMAQEAGGARRSGGAKSVVKAEGQ